MKICFVHGPWDGVEVEADYFPERIGFRKQQVAIEDVQGLEMTMSSSKGEDHQYLLKDRRLKEGVQLKVGENLEREPKEGEDICDLVNDDLIVMVYEYAPGKKLWWEE
jgi:hypothetical protein